MPRIINCLNNFITTFPNNVLVNDHPEHQCSNFDKTLSIGDIIRLTTEDSFKYLMVEYTTLSVYGFNLRVQAERVAAIAIVKDTSDFTVDGWKVSKEKPIWVLGFDEWHRDIPIHLSNPCYKVDGSIQSLSNKKPEVLDIGESGQSENESEVFDGSDSVNKAINDVGWDNKEPKGNGGEDQDDVIDKDQDDDVDWNETDQIGSRGTDQNDVVAWGDDELQYAKFASTDPLHVVDGAWQNETQDLNEKDQKGIGGKDQDDVVAWDEDELQYAKVASADPLHVVGGAWQNKIQDQQTKFAGHFAEEQQESSNIIKKDSTTTTISNKFDSDASVLDIFGGNFKAELKTNAGLAMKSDALDVYVSGPFRNARTKKSHYVVVYGSFGKAWPLKASFLCTYLHTLAGKMNSMRGAKIDANHCCSYYDINTRKHEFGTENTWRRMSPKNGKPGNTIKRMSFVVTFNTVHNNLGIERVKEAIDFFFFTMKKREANQVGELLLSYLKDHAVGLYDFLMAGAVNQDLVEEKLTNDINSEFMGGYSMSVQNPLNRFMVDFDIIRILKEYVGYTSWSDVPMSERGMCYRNYNSKSFLPEWDIEEEKYNK